MRRVLIALAPALAALALANCGGGGSGPTTFSKSFGGPAREQTTAAAALADCGYVVAGAYNNRSKAAAASSDRTPWRRSPRLDRPARRLRRYALETQLEVAHRQRVRRRQHTSARGRRSTAQAPSAWVGSHRDASDRVVLVKAFDSGPFPLHPHFFQRRAAELAALRPGALGPLADGGLLVANVVQAFVAVSVLKEYTDVALRKLGSPAPLIRAWLPF